MANEIKTEKLTAETVESQTIELKADDGSRITIRATENGFFISNGDGSSLVFKAEYGKGIKVGFYVDQNAGGPALELKVSSGGLEVEIARVDGATTSIDGRMLGAILGLVWTIPK